MWKKIQLKRWSGIWNQETWPWILALPLTSLVAPWSLCTIIFICKTGTITSHRIKYNRCQNVKHRRLGQLNKLNGNNQMDMVLEPWEPTASLIWSYFLLTWVSEETRLEWLSITTLVNYQISSSKDQCLLTSANLTQNWSGELYFCTISSQKSNFFLKTHTKKKRITKKSLFLQTQRAGNHRLSPSLSSQTMNTDFPHPQRSSHLGRQNCVSLLLIHCLFNMSSS